MNAHPAPSPQPTALTLHQKSKTLEIHFADGAVFHLPAEVLRVHSPSAEVQGHGPGQAVLQAGKREVGIADIRPVGHYGIQPVFTDGHDSGIFTWAYLHHLGSQQQALMAAYEAQLNAAGLSRDAPAPAQQPSPAGGCGHRH